MRKAFKFKQFTVSDEACAMKLGTDSVLLGCWVNPSESQAILDIGCGCGILSLMMAQKSKAMILGVEIHTESALRAQENFQNSPWSNRLLVIEQSIQEFSSYSKEKFDLIISNPPYFIDSLKAPSKERNLSRHTDTLSQDDLLDNVTHLLSIHGNFAVIIPFDQEEGFINKAGSRGLFLQQVLRIRSKPGRDFIRSCLLFDRTSGNCSTAELCIREENGSYTMDYQRFTAEFYL